ncbi:MAG: nuclear transport factor 2 family protein, partial [Gaiellaceae bacterium]
VKFFKLIQDRDVVGLVTFLSPAFQVQRADGSGTGKAEYLDRLAMVRKFRLSNLRATRAGTTLVVRYLATVEGLVNGKPYTPGPAPRLSVFHWTGKRWQLAAHANFNPLTG